MSSSENYGLSGQWEAADYDHFLCLGKKCKQRKRERHKARMAKKRAKTDARKADTERMRAETGVIRQTTSPVVTMPLTGQKIANPQSIASSGGTNKITAAGFSGNAIIIVIGVLLTGGYLYLKNKKAIHSPLPDSAL